MAAFRSFVSALNGYKPVDLPKNGGAHFMNPVLITPSGRYVIAPDTSPWLNAEGGYSFSISNLRVQSAPDLTLKARFQILSEIPLLKLSAKRGVNTLAGMRPVLKCLLAPSRAIRIVGKSDIFKAT